MHAADQYTPNQPCHAVSVFLVRLWQGFVAWSDRIDIMLCAVRRWLFYARGINFDVIICFRDFFTKNQTGMPFCFFCCRRP